MHNYRNAGGDSGVRAYSFDSNSITVKFSDGWHYLYTYESAGAAEVEEMKQLAARGSGLNGFINTRVKKDYAKKWR